MASGMVENGCDGCTYGFKGGCFDDSGLDALH